MSYDGKTDTLKDLNFTIPDGTLVSLLGPYGGGKTTDPESHFRVVVPNRWANLFW